MALVAVLLVAGVMCMTSGQDDEGVFFGLGFGFYVGSVLSLLTILTIG